MWKKLRAFSPAISLSSRAFSRNPRSTVGTVTEIYDFLRVFYARLGRMYCPSADGPMRPAADEIIADVAPAPGRKVYGAGAAGRSCRKGIRTSLKNSGRRLCPCCGWTARFASGRPARNWTNKKAQRPGGGPPGQQGNLHGRLADSARPFGDGRLVIAPPRPAGSGAGRGAVHYLGLPACHCPCRP